MLKMTKRRFFNKTSLAVEYVEFLFQVRSLTRTRDRPSAGGMAGLYTDPL